MADGVVEQVGDHLVQPLGIAGGLQVAGLDAHLQPHRPVAEDALACGLLEQPAHAERHRPELEPPALELGEVEQLGDEPAESLGLRERGAEGGRIRGLDDAALAALEAYRWPGNVRELQNVVERACALAEGEVVTPADLPDHVVHGARLTAPAVPGLDVRAGAGGLKEAKEQWMAVLEASYLRDLLDRHGGNVSAAAKAAGIDRKTFHRLINKHGLK